MSLPCIIHANLYDREPQHLEWNENQNAGNDERYYYCKRENDSREVAGRGWWKATSHVKRVHVNEVLVGCKRPLTFHRYRNNHRNRSNAIKTNWIMHEYSLESRATDWRLCKIKHKGKPSMQEEMESIRQQFEAASTSMNSERKKDQPEHSPSLSVLNSTTPSYNENDGNLHQLPQTPCGDLYYQNLGSTSDYFFNEHQVLSIEPSSDELGGSLWSWQK